MTMQRAYVFTAFGGPETQELAEMPVPEPGPGEVLVAVHAAGVNPADWKFRQGLFGRKKPLPLPLGREGSGVVVAVGEDVEGIAVGDEVFGTATPASGTFAEHALLNGRQTARKPAAVSFADAATLPVSSATAYDALAQLDLQPGQTLVVNGIGGGVGLAATQIARDRGVAVYGTEGEAKRELVEALGAVVVAYGDGVADRLRALLPDGADAVLDLVGGQSLRAVAPLATRPERVVTTNDPDTAGEIGAVYVQRDPGRGTLEAVARLVAEGRLDPQVRDVLPLAEAGQAMAAVEQGTAHGKVVVQVRGERN